MLFSFLSYRLSKEGVFFSMVSPSRMLLYLSILFFYSLSIASCSNLTLPHQHPDPDSVAQDVLRRVNASISRRQMLSNAQSQCLTGNPIDDCWKCDPNWGKNRQRLADCAVGFGQGALGGKGGQIYVVTDSSDNDVVNPTLGTLRYAVIQEEPLWIIFESNMQIRLKHELIMNSYKTIDGRGANIEITGGGCITLQYVSNVIIENVRIYNCVPTGNTNIRSSPTHMGYRGRSDGDGISIFGARNIWIDHCSLSHCTDGLIDMIMGSTAITVSNSDFSQHDDVMLLGHDDNYLPDSGMQVTIAFNHFGEGLTQRMPRIRRGYVQVVNNDYTAWKMYALGGSASPTINSQGNRYIAPSDPDAKEVTRREDTDENGWNSWNWRTDGDIMVNGAFFVPSGEGLSTQYAMASTVDPKSAGLLNQITANAGCSGGPRDNSGIISDGGSSPTGDSAGKVHNSGTGGGGDDDIFGMMFGGGAPPPTVSISTTTVFLSLSIILILYSGAINCGAMLFLLRL